MARAPKERQPVGQKKRGMGGTVIWQPSLLSIWVHLVITSGQWDAHPSKKARIWESLQQCFGFPCWPHLSSPDMILPKDPTPNTEWAPFFQCFGLSRTKDSPWSLVLSSGAVFLPWGGVLLTISFTEALALLGKIRSQKPYCKSAPISIFTLFLETSATRSLLLGIWEVGKTARQSVKVEGCLYQDRVQISSVMFVTRWSGFCSKVRSPASTHLHFIVVLPRSKHLLPLCR